MSSIMQLWEYFLTVFLLTSRVQQAEKVHLPHCQNRTNVESNLKISKLKILFRNPINNILEC
jgi:hypothetical protein